MLDYTGLKMALKDYIGLYRILQDKSCTDRQTDCVAMPNLEGLPPLKMMTTSKMTLRFKTPVN